MKTVLITGASRGIGKATAEKFLKEGWKVIGASKSGRDNIRQPNFQMYELDMAQPASIKNFMDILKKASVKIDALVNNAGILTDNDQTINSETFRSTMEVNVFGLIDLTEQILPLINAGGHIINLSSGLGSITEATSGYYPTYRISKAAVNMFTRTLGARLKSKDILVASIDPGWVRTDMGGAGASRNPSEPANEIYELSTTNYDTGYFWHRGKKRSW